MIERHDFNSRWWGGEVGILRDEAFFALDPEQRAAQLAAWEWVEHRRPFDPSGALQPASAGFVQVDTQLVFRIGLAKLGSTPSVARLAVEFADETPFSPKASELTEFRHERFNVLPGATSERVIARYALWSEELIGEHPDTCLRVLDRGEVQGWFLSRRTEKGLELTLAMLRRGSHISGVALYHRALNAYAARGFRLGSAGFSVTNTAVLGIYASLGARFLTPQGCWLWAPGWEAARP